MSRRIAVVASSDANWAWQSLFVLTRSIAFDTGQEIDHHLYLSGSPDPRILAAIPGEIRCHRIAALPDYFAQGAQAHVPAAAMLRLLALEELAPAYERVIYIDGDVFQSWGSLADLARVRLNGAVLGAVRDAMFWTGASRPFFERYANALSSGIGQRYFNSGVFVADGAAYARAQISRRGCDFLRDTPQRCRFGDQSALNAVVAGSWAELSAGWNWQLSDLVYGLTDGRRPRLIHFTGPLKPWRDELRLLPPAAFEAMRVFLGTRGWLDLLGKSSPLGFDPRRDERMRTRRLEPFLRDTFVRRETVKAYLDREDFADLQSGISGWG